ncbi:MAG: FMN-binding negative transcriptional regulator [Ferroplasma sp.]
MYIPEEFKIEDIKVIKDFINNNNFGILLSIYKNKIYNTQIPLLLQENDGQLILSGHMARANMQWYYSKNGPVAVLFTGPHHYISPLYYKDKDSVPTWDYMTVRIDGILELLDEEDTRKLLLDLSTYFDKNWAGQGNDKREYYNKMVLQIVAFKIRITEINGKFKLSQNRPEDIGNISMNLEKLGDEDALAIAKYMKK